MAQSQRGGAVVRDPMERALGRSDRGLVVRRLRQQRSRPSAQRVLPVDNLVGALRPAAGLIGEVAEHRTTVRQRWPSGDQVSRDTKQWRTRATAVSRRSRTRPGLTRSAFQRMRVSRHGTGRLSRWWRSPSKLPGMSCSGKTSSRWLDGRCPGRWMYGQPSTIASRGRQWRTDCAGRQRHGNHCRDCRDAVTRIGGGRRCRSEWPHQVVEVLAANAQAPLAAQVRGQVAGGDQPADRLDRCGDVDGGLLESHPDGLGAGRLRVGRAHVTHRPG